MINIKELAEQAGIGSLYGKNWAYSNELTRFAELVAAAEREACIKLLEDFSKTDMVPVKDTWRMGLIAGANAIRARGEK
jgi:hypothetical protein